MSTSVPLSPWLEYALASGVVTEPQLQSAQGLAQRLAKIGLRKTVEEILVISGRLTRERHAEVARRVEAEWKLKVPRLNIAPLSALADSSTFRSFQEMGPDGLKKIEECREIQRRIEKLGLAFPLWEIAQARGYRVAKPDPTPTPLPRVPLADGAEGSVATAVHKTTRRWVVADQSARRAMASAPARARDTQKTLIGLVAGGAGLLVLGFAAWMFLGGSPEPVLAEQSSPAVSKAPEASKAPVSTELEATLARLNREADAIQDRINVLGLWTAVEDLRGRVNERERLVDELDREEKRLREKISEAVKAGGTLPTRPRLGILDTVTRIGSFKIYEGPAMDNLPKAVELLRAVKAGTPVEIGVHRKGAQITLHVEFRSAPQWPE